MGLGEGTAVLIYFIKIASFKCPILKYTKAPQTVHNAPVMKTSTLLKVHSTLKAYARKVHKTVLSIFLVLTY